MTIVLHCHRCGTEITSELSRDAVCFACLTREALADWLPELKRLIRKATRYRASGAHINPEPLQRWHVRAQRRLVTAIPPHHVRDHLSTLISEVEQSAQREISGSRIERALPGDLAAPAATTSLVHRLT